MDLIPSIDTPQPLEGFSGKESQSKEHPVAALIKTQIGEGPLAVGLVHKIIESGLLEQIIQHPGSDQNPVEKSLSDAVKGITTDKEAMIRLASALSRIQIAEQSQNRYHSVTGGEDLLRGELENGVLKEGVLVISMKKGEQDRYQVRTLAGEEETQVVQAIINPRTVEALQEEIKMYDGKEQWPNGVKQLHKKISHAHSPSRQGVSRQSAFAQYQNIRFATSNIPRILDYASTIIGEIMEQRATILIKDHRIDIINPYGRGIRITNPESSDPRIQGKVRFVGFVDSAFYTEPRRQKEKATPLKEAV